MSDELINESNIIPLDKVEGIDTSNVPQDDLAMLKELGDTLNDLNNKVLAAEAEVSDLKATRTHVAEELIPDLMNKVGLKLIQLDNGAKIQINEFVDARIKDAEVAFDWLRNQQRWI